MNNMKKKKPSYLFVAIFLAAISSISGVQCYADDEIPIVIICEDGSSSNGDPGHHAPALIPIQAVYYPSDYTILVDFLNDLGPVSVKIENLSTGVYTISAINATQGEHLFFISGYPGIYEITFLLSSGLVYVGAFELD